MRKNLFVHDRIQNSPDGLFHTVSDSLLFQQLSTVQDLQNLPTPNTIASAATIAPTNFLTFVSGTIDVTTITPPITGVCLIGLVFTNASPGDILTTGNVLVGNTTIAQNKLVLLAYNNSTAKWYTL